MRNPLRGDRRLRKSYDFRYVRQHGRSWACPLLVVRTCPNSLGTTRVGFSVGRRVGKAVVRNRVKRRLRELMRQEPVKEGFDIVLIARTPASRATFRELAQAVDTLLTRARLRPRPNSSGRTGQ